MPRTFAAVHLPEFQRERLAAHLEACREIAPDLRWVRPEGLHLTLRFIGNASPSTVERVRAELAKVRWAPFRIWVGGTGTFGGRAASVLWLGVAGGTRELAQLAEACEPAFRMAGVEPEARPFRPHLTLARAGRTRVTIPDLPPPPELEPWTVDEFVLFESALEPGGARYSILQAYPAR